MLLKRIYDTPEGWERKLNLRGTDGALADPAKPEGVCLNPPPLAYVALAHTGIAPEQNFSKSLVEGAIAEGWATLAKGKLVLHVQPEDLVYAVTRMPGRYCCHCGARQDDEKGARAHIVAAHAGKASPDKSNPAGYAVTNAYECVLEPALHEKHRLPPERKHRAPVFHLKPGHGKRAGAAGKGARHG